MHAREVLDEQERTKLWTAAAAFPPYDEYQAKATRKIPMFIVKLR